MQKITVYGIPNCDVTKKALKWLHENKIEFNFHDYKKMGISKTTLKEWTSKAGLEIVLNKKGATWKNLSEKIKSGITNENAAIDLMAEQTSLIKRPVIEIGKVLLVGFKETEYHKHIKIKK